MIRQSESIANLATALCNAQGEFPVIPKTKVVDFTHNGKRTYYKYADLSDIIEKIKPVLTKWKLAHSQDLDIIDEGTNVVLRTTIMHASGEWKTGYYPIHLGNKPQDSGAAITYGRRYTLCGALGIQSEEDHDGETAPQNNDHNPAKNKGLKANPANSPVKPKQITNQISPAKFDITSAWKQIHEIRNRLKWSMDQLNEFISNATIKEVKSFTLDDFSILISLLNQHLAKQSVPQIEGSFDSFKGEIVHVGQ